ncbi:hypothetical protein F4860DRAFT_517372 [Xylaria cubensis]|nr:hypothetical protein F4860DRAFT_517372 [Xylaria cubensis]
MLRQSSADGCRPSTALVDTLAESLLPPFQTDAPDDTNCTWLVEGDQNDEDIDDPWWSTRHFFRTSRHLCYEQSHIDKKPEEVSGDPIPLALSMSPSMFFGMNLSQQDASFQQPLPDNDDDVDSNTSFPLCCSERPDDSIYGSRENQSQEYQSQEYQSQEYQSQEYQSQEDESEEEDDGAKTPPWRPPPPGPDQLPIPLHITSKRNSERRKNVLRIRRRREFLQDYPSKDDSPGPDYSSSPLQDRRLAMLKRRSRLRHITWSGSKQYSRLNKR